jgi:hypothetical protein
LRFLGRICLVLDRMCGAGRIRDRQAVVAVAAVLAAIFSPSHFDADARNRPGTVQIALLSEDDKGSDQPTTSLIFICSTF